MARNTDRRDSAPQWKYDRRINARATLRIAPFREADRHTMDQAVIFNRSRTAQLSAMNGGEHV